MRVRLRCAGFVAILHVGADEIVIGVIPEEPLVADARRNFRRLHADKLVERVDGEDRVMAARVGEADDISDGVRFSIPKRWGEAREEASRNVIGTYIKCPAACRYRFHIPCLWIASEKCLVPGIDQVSGAP